MVAQLESDNPCEVDAALCSTRELREAAIKSPMHGEAAYAITVASLRAAAKRFRKGTAIGTDNIDFDDIDEASDESLGELARIMRDSVRQLALPIQTLLTLIGLLGKKGGGSRAIAICATYYRLLMAVLSGSIWEWDGAHAQQRDSAVAGRSPQDETAWRHLWVERAAVQGRKAAAIL